MNQQQAISDALDLVENPGVHPVGAPNSEMRRAQDLGKRLALSNARVRELEALLVEVLPYIGVLRLIERVKDTLAASAPAGEQEKTSEETARLSPADASTACARCGILGTLHGATPPHTRGDTCVGFLAASALGLDPSKEQEK